MDASAGISKIDGNGKIYSSFLQEGKGTLGALP